MFLDGFFSKDWFVTKKIKAGKKAYCRPVFRIKKKIRAMIDNRPTNERTMFIVITLIVSLYETNINPSFDYMPLFTSQFETMQYLAHE